MKFFAGTTNTISLATHIVLEEIGAPYELLRLDMAAAQQRSDEYLKINPKGRVPALVLDDGILTETPAILVYLAQTYPAAGLLPEGTFAFARLQEICAYLCATVHPAHAHGMRGTRWVEPEDTQALEAMKRKVPKTVTEGFLLIEHGYLKGPWVMGDQFTIADPYLFTIARWLESDGADLSVLPRVLDHRARVAARPATQRALAAYA